MPAAVNRTNNFSCKRHNNYLTMEERRFKGRLEEVEWLDSQKGWGPLTEEDKAALDDAVRMITNLN